MKMTQSEMTEQLSQAIMLIDDVRNALENEHPAVHQEQGGDGSTWCDHGKCYTEPDHYTHCYCSREERFEKRQLSLTFEN